MAEPQCSFELKPHASYGWVLACSTCSFEEHVLSFQRAYRHLRVHQRQVRRRPHAESIALTREQFEEPSGTGEPFASPETKNFTEHTPEQKASPFDSEQSANPQLGAAVCSHVNQVGKACRNVADHTGNHRYVKAG